MNSNQFSDADVSTIQAALESLGINSDPAPDVAEASLGTSRLDADDHKNIRAGLRRYGSAGLPAYINRGRK